MEITAVNVQRLYRQVADQLTQMIQAGTPAPGERLPPERELAERFAVSRPTIREAMLALEINGLVEIRSGSGVYVQEREQFRLNIDLDAGPGPFEILQARLAVEGEACALAAGTITPAQLQQLEALLVEMERENAQQCSTERADQDFHTLIAEATGNSAISAIVVWLWQLRNESEISTRFHRRVRLEGSRPIVADHRRLLSALQAGDAERSREALHQHIQRVIDSLLS